MEQFGALYCHILERGLEAGKRGQTEADCPYRCADRRKVWMDGLRLGAEKSREKDDDRFEHAVLLFGCVFVIAFLGAMLNQYVTDILFK